MAQVSKRILRKEVEERITSLFISSITLSDTRNLSLSLINDLLTPTEKIMLAKRFSIAFLLIEGYDYSTIAHILKVSYATIGTVSNWLKIKGEGMRKITDKIKKSESVKKIWEDIEEGIADLFLSAPGMNWRNSKKVLWQMKQSREKPF